MSKYVKVRRSVHDEYPIYIELETYGYGGKKNRLNALIDLDDAKVLSVELQQLIEDIETVTLMDATVIADSVRGGGEPCNATISRERDGAGARPVSEGGAE